MTTPSIPKWWQDVIGRDYADLQKVVVLKGRQMGKKAVRNKAAQEVAARRKSKDHLEMLKPKHLKIASAKATPEEHATKLATAKERREAQESTTRLKSAMNASMTAMLRHMSQVMISTPFNAQSVFGQLGGGIAGARAPVPLRGRRGTVTVPAFFVVDDLELPFSAPTLEMLDQREPVMVPGPEKPCPDYVECITAWRAWDVDQTLEGLRLSSVGKTTRWEPRQPFNATCVRTSTGFAGFFGEPLDSSHRAPAFDCACGIWGFKDRATLLSKLSAHHSEIVKVIGTVSLWGTVVETEFGWRAQHGYPAQLYLLHPGLTDLSWIYNVPVRSL